MAITAPYNFVPINEQVYHPTWGDEISMDIPFEDGEDGYIEVTFRNVSPLFTRNGARIEMGTMDKEVFSSHVIDQDGKRRYFIPGTTIKGMLRSTLEIMAFGKINEKEHYSNRWFGFRDVAQKTNESKTYVKKVQNGKPGWLSKKGEKYYFQFCEGELKTIKCLFVYGLHKTYKPSTSIWKTNCSLTGEKATSPTYPPFTDDKGNHYRIVCTGSFGKKHHELLFPAELGKTITLSEDTVNAFLTVYEFSPDFNEYNKALDRGESVPVFYLDDATRPIIGMSKMFRLPYKNSLTEMICKDQPATGKDKCDLCETMFGRVSDRGKNALKGRIQVGHAFGKNLVDDNELIEVTGILGQPKASYYPLYVKQDGKPWKTYDNGKGLSGRKVYRTHKRAKNQSEFPQGNDNDNIKNHFKALPAGNEFSLRINIHNLKKVEIGALLSALTLHETNDAYHNLGLAKSFGYGKIKIVDIVLHHLNYKREEYEHSFEKEMDKFLAEKGVKTKWHQTTQISKLVNIHREHEDSVVKLMELGDNKTEGTYTYYKDKKNFDTLHEEGDRVKSLINPLDDFRESNAEEYRRIDSLVDDKDFIIALNVLDTLIDQLETKRLEHKEEDKKRVEIVRLLEEQRSAKNEEKEKLLQQERERKLEAGLAAALDERKTDGGYKVTSFKQCLNKVEEWLKKKGSDSLDDIEKETVEQSLSRIAANPDKKELRDLKRGKFNWTRVGSLLGDDFSIKLKELLGLH